MMVLDRTLSYIQTEGSAADVRASGDHVEIDTVRNGHKIGTAVYGPEDVVEVQTPAGRIAVAPRGEDFGLLPFQRFTQAELNRVDL
jgi:hypothetical protein